MSDDESTQEIEIAALRESLSRTPGAAAALASDELAGDAGALTTRGSDPLAGHATHDAATPRAARSPADDEPPSITRIDASFAPGGRPAELRGAEPSRAGESAPVLDLDEATLGGLPAFGLDESDEWAQARVPPSEPRSTVAALAPSARGALSSADPMEVTLTTISVAAPETRRADDDELVELIELAAEDLLDELATSAEVEAVSPTVAHPPLTAPAAGSTQELAEARALEGAVERAAGRPERVRALVDLADFEESRRSNRARAAELLEDALALDASHVPAMKGLERCYHALRDWTNLARILGHRAEQARDKKVKLELFERAAEVFEAKLGDLPTAASMHENLLVVEPKHRRALVDLARLYDKLGDWDRFAMYKARIADLAPTKRARSQELVKLGDLLAAPERDPLAAKLQYERAVAMDAANVAGWAALQRIAAEEGDDRRVIECLEQRSKHSDVARQRAIVLVELGGVHRARGDHDAARKAFEAAVRADPANEAAAALMLEAYAAERRWVEAAPLCELLVNAAVRDRDGDALFARLRLATRIAAALGDLARAMASTLAALDARPADPDAELDLVELASQRLGEGPSALEKARAHLAEIAARPDALDFEPLVRLARVQRALGDADRAADLLERARRLAPEARDVEGELSEIYLARGDHARACALKIDLARVTTDPETRFDLLCEAGEIWSRRAGDFDAAMALFEEARAIEPRDPWLLRAIAWVHGERGEWRPLVAVLEELAEVQESDQEKIGTLLTAAGVARDKLGDRLRAADVFDRVLDVDPARLDAFESLVRAVTEAKDWERLERSYRRMLGRVKASGAADLEFALFHQLGLIYRDRLGDAARAYDALDAALRLRPEHLEVRKIVVELLVVTDNLDLAVARLRETQERTPLDPQLYAELYDLFLRQRAFDKAWCAVNVLAALGRATADQRRFHEDYPPAPLDRVPGQLVESAWQTHLLHGELDPVLTELFATMTPAVARARHAQLRPERQIQRPLTPAHAPMYDVVRATFDDAAEILGARSPELLLGDAASVVPFAPALAPLGATVVSVPAIQAQAGSLVYLAGKRLAEQRPELTARALSPSVTELAKLVTAAVRVSRGEAAKDAASAALDESLSLEDKAALRRIIRDAAASGAALDVKRWFVAADWSSARAGLLLAGDVAPARAAILAAPSAEGSAEERVGEIYKFATSDLYADLRGAVGVAVEG